MNSLISGKIWEPPDYNKYSRAGEFAVKIVRDGHKDQGLIKCTSPNFVKDLHEDDHVAFVGSWKGENRFSFRVAHNITRNKTTGSNPFFPVAVSLVWFILTAILLDISGSREYIYFGAVIPILLFLFLSWKHRNVANMLDHFDQYNKLNRGYRKSSTPPRSDDDAEAYHSRKRSFVHGYSSDSEDDPLTWENTGIAGMSSINNMELVEVPQEVKENLDSFHPLCNDPFSDDPFCSSHVGGIGHFSEDAFCGDVAHLHHDDSNGNAFQVDSFDNSSDPFSDDF